MRMIDGRVKASKHDVNVAPMYIVFIQYRLFDGEAYFPIKADTMFKAMQEAEQYDGDDVNLIKILEKDGRRRDNGILYLDRLTNRSGRGWKVSCYKNNEEKWDCEYNDVYGHAYTPNFERLHGDDLW